MFSALIHDSSWRKTTEAVRRFQKASKVPGCIVNLTAVWRLVGICEQLPFIAYQ